ncbi:hypothetical protein [Nesterenkonia sp. PF2B19]|uniref:hypothetical protein n=1 Tax=Nesterenkonia sp. PF2B19 TaxID=1881858 RepID=UPI0026813989
MSLEGQPGAAPGGYAAGLDADLYGFAERLTSTEQSVLEELHAVLQAEVRPRLAEPGTPPACQRRSLRR